MSEFLRDALPVSERPDYVVALDLEPVDPRAGGYFWTACDGSLLIGSALPMPTGDGHLRSAVPAGSETRAEPERGERGGVSPTVIAAPRGQSPAP